jgi:hypothetical protein
MEELLQCSKNSFSDASSQTLQNDHSRNCDFAFELEQSKVWFLAAAEPSSTFMAAPLITFAEFKAGGRA